MWSREGGEGERRGERGVQAGEGKGGGLFYLGP